MFRVASSTFGAAGTGSAPIRRSFSYYPIHPGTLIVMLAVTMKVGIFLVLRPLHTGLYHLFPIFQIQNIVREQLSDSPGF